MGRARLAWLAYVPLGLYTAFAAGPFVWTLAMSLRTTQEIYANPYGAPIPPHLDGYLEAWTKFGYARYFQNSIVVTVSAVLLGTIAGAMAAFVLSRERYRFRLREKLEY